MRKKSKQREHDETQFIDAMRELMRVCLTCSSESRATSETIFSCAQQLAAAQKMQRAISNRDLREAVETFFYTANRLYEEAYNEAVQAVDDTAVVAVECLLAVQDRDFEKAKSHLKTLSEKSAVDYHEFLQYAIVNAEADAYEEENRVIMQ